MYILPNTEWNFTFVYNLTRVTNLFLTFTSPIGEQPHFSAVFKSMSITTSQMKCLFIYL